MLQSEQRLECQPVTPVATAHQGEDPRGVPYWWLALEYPLGAGTPGTDLAAVAAGFISITPLRADMTDDAWLTDLARVLSADG